MTTCPANQSFGLSRTSGRRGISQGHTEEEDLVYHALFGIGLQALDRRFEVGPSCRTSVDQTKVVFQLDMHQSVIYLALGVKKRTVGTHNLVESEILRSRSVLDEEALHCLPGAV